MKQHLRITDECIFIDNKRVQWNEIVGIRNFNSSLLHQIGTRFPFSEIFLKGGKVVKIRSKLIIEGIELESFDDKYRYQFKEYFTALNIISDKAKNMKQDISEWIEWRLLLPIILTEAILILYGLLSHKNFMEIVIIALVGGMLSVPLGWIWEHKDRKERWK